MILPSFPFQKKIKVLLLLQILMPGHPIVPAQIAQTLADITKLKHLIDEHDVIFLLMDSRESRWVPSFLGGMRGE
jgi:ubiquitin-like modifier-activating enzyme ATG7